MSKTSKTPVLMKSKYDSTCSTCGENIPKGADMLYVPAETRSNRAYHPTVKCSPLSDNSVVKQHSKYPSSINTIKMEKETRKANPEALKTLTSITHGPELREKLEAYKNQLPLLSEGDLKQFGSQELRDVVRVCRPDIKGTDVARMNKKKCIAAIQAAEISEGENKIETPPAKSEENKHIPETPPTPKKTPRAMPKAEPNVDGNLSPLEQQIVSLVQQHSVTQMDFASIKDEIETSVLDILETAQSSPSKVLIVDGPNVDASKLDLSHKSMPRLIRKVQAGLHTLLVGPSGSGKNHAAEQIASLFDLEFFTIALTTSTPDSKVFGYTTPDQKIVETPVSRWAVNGGLLFVDELDNANPQTAISLNSALANGYLDLPGRGLTRLHEDCICLAGANTAGKGGTQEYRRVVQDMALLSRFAFLAWGYDEELERAIAHSIRPSDDALKMHFNGNLKNWTRIVDAWVSKSHKYRAALKSAGILAHPMTPRQTLSGLRELAVGAPENEVIEDHVRRDLDDVAWSKVEARM